MYEYIPDEIVYLRKHISFVEKSLSCQNKNPLIYSNKLYNRNPCVGGLQSTVTLPEGSNPPQ